MLCQHCNHNDAFYHFTLSDGQQTGDVHLCADCAAKLARQYQGWMSRMGQGGGQGWSVPFPDAGGFALSAERFPVEAEEGFRARRRIGQLRAQLKRAVETEDYETAARLRDEIAAAQRQGRVVTES